MIVYVKEQGACVRKRGSRILIEKDDQTLREIPLKDTAAVAVFGNVQVTTQALAVLLDAGIPLSLLSRHGRLRGRLVPDDPRDAGLLLAQFGASTNAASSLAAARALVGAKLWNSAAVIGEFHSNHPALALEGDVTALKAAAHAAVAAATVAEVMGHEGAGAALYFGAFASMNLSGLPFPGRRKHPATDPVNALLSLAYTLATNEIHALLAAAGLAPEFGFLHSPDRTRPSLALDLVEPFRSSLCDRLVLRLVNTRVLRAEHFGSRPAGGGVILLPDAFAAFLTAYEEAVESPRTGAPNGFRHAFQMQADGLVGWLRGNPSFLPWLEEDS